MPGDMQDSRMKLSIDDLAIESFDTMEDFVNGTGTVRGYETEDTGCLTQCWSCVQTECCTNGTFDTIEDCQSFCHTCAACYSWDTCPQQCASTPQATC